MCDNFEFDDDDDDLLLSIVCTPTEQTSSPLKRLSKAFNESDSSKRPKLDDHINLSPPLFDTANITSESAHTTTNSNIDNNPCKDAQYCVKRIFPGPAGIFSDTNVTLNSQIPVFSQNTSVIFQDGPWQEMSKDFKISATLCLHDKFNIAWLKKEAATNQFACQKAPFLAAILVSFEVSDLQTQKCVNITLKDKTGTIQGNILHRLYEEYSSHFTLGSILILVQFGVLSCTCDKCDNHHLTITPKNLCAIYKGNEKIVIKKIHPKDVLNDFYRKRQELNAEIPPKSSVSSSRICNFSLLRKHASNGTLSLGNANNTVERPRTVGQQRETPFLFKKTIPTNSLESQDKTINISESRHTNSSRKLFTFKKLSSSEVNIKNTTQTGCSENNIKLAGSQISVRVDNKEHEKLWKDALDDVDINSFFEDDF